MPLKKSRKQNEDNVEECASVILLCYDADEDTFTEAPQEDNILENLSDSDSELSTEDDIDDSGDSDW